jgi:hypothetical protein
MQKTKLKDRAITKLLSIGLPQIIFWVGVTFVAIFLFLYKFHLIYQLSTAEAAQFSKVNDLSNIFSSPVGIISSSLQYLLYKLSLAASIFNLTSQSILRFPSALILLSSLILASASIKKITKSSLAAPIFFLISVTSPLAITYAHRGYAPFLDIFLLVGLSVFSYLAIIDPSSSVNKKTAFWAVLAASLGLLSLNQLGIIPLLILLACLFFSPQFKDSISKLPKVNLYLGFASFALLFMLTIALAVFNQGYLNQLIGLDIFKDLIKNPGQIIQSLKDLTALSKSSQTLGVANLYLAALLTLALYLASASKKIKPSQLKFYIPVASLFLVSLALSLSLPSLLPPQLLATLLSAFIIATSISQTKDLLDSTFPINPYPRIISFSVLILIVLMICWINLATFSGQSIRTL